MMNCNMSLFDNESLPCILPNSLDLTRLPSKAKAQMTSGQGSHWLIESSTMFHLYFIYMLLAFTQSVDNLFHSFIVKQCCIFPKSFIFQLVHNGTDFEYMLTVLHYNGLSATWRV